MTEAANDNKARSKYELTTYLCVALNYVYTYMRYKVVHTTIGSRSSVLRIFSLFAFVTPQLTQDPKM